MTLLLAILPALGQETEPLPGADAVPDCPDAVPYDCENLTSPQLSCVGITTTEVYAPDQNGDCVLVDISQQATSPADIPWDLCPTGNPTQIQFSASDTDGCPDAFLTDYEVFEPGAWCCADCSIATYERVSRLLFDSETGTFDTVYECVPVDHDPFQPGTQPITTDRFCFPGACDDLGPRVTGPNPPSFRPQFFQRLKLSALTPTGAL